ncbi:hypothetical protein GGI25_002200 [Coemansia spiralis]|uniref:Eukaryotic translation initiation factor 5A n=2 Tax=Coemansia TaxID=4863 RepID=A0A9W8KZK8_9FUNG|nr:eukaryotic translation initiation factor-like protein 5A [Coemansia spiralis]KAJ1996210.1 hypothetical protein EDC05_000100 [Coemansia umbellata]KAJ2626034.1 hypothetical protein GGI26_000118 [Coemansia sp. RSA 1358]KAJ2678612.1 hypothetical protein GGI25_002200 [Coemansia spiralis]
MADENKDDQHYENFESTAGANSSLTTPLQCSALRKGGHVVIKGRPCKIIDMSTSKTGKHGHAKVNLICTDVFTGKRLEDMSPSTHNMDVPILSRTDYLVIYIDEDDGFLSMQTLDTAEPRDDIKVPDNELGEQIRAELLNDKEIIVTVLSAMGESHAVAWKPAPRDNQ